MRQESFTPNRKHHENARRTEEDVQEVVLDDAEARRVDLDGLVPVELDEVAQLPLLVAALADLTSNPSGSQTCRICQQQKLK